MPERVAWRSGSSGEDGERLEVVWRADGVCLRTTGGGVSLHFSYEEWDAFVAAVNDNHFDIDRLA